MPDFCDIGAGQERYEIDALLAEYDPNYPEWDKEGMVEFGKMSVTGVGAVCTLMLNGPCMQAASWAEVSIETWDYLQGDLSSGSALSKPVMGVVGNNVSDSISDVLMPNKVERILQTGNYMNGYLIDSLADSLSKEEESNATSSK